MFFEPLTSISGASFVIDRFIRTVLTSMVTLLAGAMYSRFGSAKAWAVMLSLSAGLIAMSVLMYKKDRGAYTNLYS